MAYPPLVNYSTPEEYRAHFERLYCRGPISTKDGVRVRFRKSDFDHCMFKTDRRTREKTTEFAAERAERIDWIQAALQDAAALLLEGWDNKNKSYDPQRRVTLIYNERYVVVIAMTGASQANFITAYLADAETIEKMKKSPVWRPAP
jgi:plasmid maintenance system killer protein